MSSKKKFIHQNVRQARLAIIYEPRHGDLLQLLMRHTCDPNSSYWSVRITVQSWSITSLPLIDYKCHIPFVKPLLNLKQKHLTKTKDKKNWIIAQWSKAIFSGEGKFCIPLGNEGLSVWRKRIYRLLLRRKWETTGSTMQMAWRQLSKQIGLPLHLGSDTDWWPPCHGQWLV